MPVKINYHLCKGCKACYTECPADVIGWDDEKAIPYIAYPDECWHCGVCKLECPEEAMIHTLPPQCWIDINKRFISMLGRKGI
jgi:adenylylsulfate reductase subunit B